MHGRSGLASQSSQPSEARGSQSRASGGGGPFSALGPLCPSRGLEETLRRLGTQCLSTWQGKSGAQASARTVEVGEPPGTGAGGEGQRGPRPP